MNLWRRAAWTVVGAAAIAATGGCAGESAGLGEPTIVENPAGPGSMAPNLTVGLDGVVYLSWVEPQGAGHAMRFSKWQDGRWTEPKTIAAGERWFVNWADFPSMAALRDGTLAAHWLVRSGEASYAYDVTLALSRDNGDTWSEPFTPHRDGTATEHGFVSLVPARDGHFDVIWLDGRKMAESPPGAMTLRYAALGANGSLQAEAEVDPRVCDCCSTDALRTNAGALLVAYRDRTASEVRDISVSLLRESGWSQPQAVHADGWEIAACPVNGPAADAGGGDLIAVAWFTDAADSARVQVAFSRDDGRTFGEPQRVDDGDPLGRVDVVMLGEESALVSWLERDADRARIVLRRVTPAGISPSKLVATTSRARSSGFPRMVAVDDQAVLAWTEGGDPSRIGTAVIRK
jgi:hypothetical protein